MTSINSIMGMSTGSTKRLTGLASGMDVESLIQGMTIGTRTKIATQLQSKQTLQWKMDAYRSITSPLIAFAEKFSQFPSKSNLLSTSFFGKNKVDMIGSNSKYLSVSGSSSSAANIDILAVKQLAKDAMGSVKNASDKTMETGEFDIGGNSSVSQVLGKSITIRRGGENGTTYTLDLKDKLSYKDSSGQTVDVDLKYDTLEDVKNSINELIKHDDEYAGLRDLEVGVEAGTDGGNLLTFKNKGGTGGDSYTITNGSANVLNTLGIEKDTTIAGGAADATKGKEVKDADLVKTMSTVEALAEKTLTFTYNGVSKTIKLGTKDELSALIAGAPDQGAAFAGHLQDKIDEAFGKNRVKVSFNSTNNSEGTYSFQTVKGSSGVPDDYSVFKLTSGDVGLLGETGILKTQYGESNRLNTNATLKDCGFNFGGQPLEAHVMTEEVKLYNEDGTPKLDDQGNQMTKKTSYKGYMLDVNGKTVVIKEDDTLGDAIRKINDSDAGVKVAYNETADTLTFTATVSGAAGETKITNTAAGTAYTSKDGNTTIKFDDSTAQSNLGAALSGAGGGLIETPGQDAIIVVDFDGEGGDDPVEISRSSNNFNIDGLNITAKATFDSFRKDADGNYLDKDGTKLTNVKTDKNGNFVLNEGQTGSEFRVNMTGNYVDEQGRAVNVHGTLVDANGTGYVDKNGKQANKYGATVDAAGTGYVNTDGKTVNKYGTLVDAAGNYVDKNNNYVDAQGNASTTAIAATADDLKVANDDLAVKSDDLVAKSGVPVIDYADKVVSFDPKVDSDAVVDAVKEMVEEYNKLVDLINTELTTKHDRNYPPLTAEQKEEMSEDEIKAWETEAKKGLLYGDTDLQNLAQDLRFVFSNYMSKDSALGLKSIGISNDGGGGSNAYSNNGKITLDEEKLRTALAERPEDVQKLFTDSLETSTDANGKTVTNFMSGGCMARMKYVTDKYAATMGATKGILVEKAGSPKSPLSMLQNTMLKQMTDIDKMVTSLKRRLSVEETRYNNQFTALEKLVSQMNSQSAYLSQMTGGTM